MDQEKPLAAHLHFIMAMVGGFLGAYAILNRSDIFGSAQTANMIELAMGIFGKSSGEVLIRVIALLLTISALVATTIIPKHIKINMHIFSIILDMLAVFALGFFPKSMNNLVALYPVFFASTFQWNCFRGVSGFGSSTIFSTNNLRQTVTSFIEYLYKKDEKELNKAKIFGGTILYYHIGVILSYFSTKKFEIRGAWICIFPLIIALGIAIYQTDLIQARINTGNGSGLGL